MSEDADTGKVNGWKARYSDRIARGERIEVTRTEEDQELWDSLQDIISGEPPTPRYPAGLIGGAYERMMREQCLVNNGLLEGYAGSWLPALAPHIHPSVRVQPGAYNGAVTKSIDGYTLLIGDSAAGKSPIIEAVMAPTLALKQIAYNVMTEDKAGPLLKQKMGGMPCVANMTLERLIQIMIVNKGQGLLGYSDEWATFFDATMAKTKGEAVQMFSALNSAYNNGPLERNRMNVKEGDLFVMASRLSLLIGVQKETLFGLSYYETLVTSGFFGRIDPVVLNVNYKCGEDPEAVDPEALPAWEKFLTEVRTLENITFYLGRDDAADWSGWKRETEALATRYRGTVPQIAHWLEKSDLRVLRAAAALSIEEYIETEGVGRDDNARRSPEGHVMWRIGHEALRRATTLHDRFWLENVIYLHETMPASDQFLQVARRLLDKILAEELSGKGMSRKALVDTPLLRHKPEGFKTALLNYVIQLGFISVKPGKVQRRTGSTDGAASQFVVNKFCAEKFRDHIEAARARWGAVTAFRATRAWEGKATDAQPGDEMGE